MRPDGQSQPPAPDAAEHSDADLQAMFQRTSATGPPVDADALWSVTAAMRAMRLSAARRCALAAAASFLLVVGAAAGWYAGLRVSAQHYAQLERTLDADRQQLAARVEVVARSLQTSIEAERTRDAKRLAVLLRDDYGTQIAAVRAELHRLSLTLDELLAAGRTRQTARQVSMLTE